MKVPHQSGTLPRVENSAGRHDSSEASGDIRTERKRAAAAAREARYIENWPLLPLPALGRITSFGPSRQSYTLSPKEHAFAVNLRTAATSGDDFIAMIESIQSAGFAIRPAISRKSEDHDYFLGGFRFERGGLVLAASDASLRILPHPNVARSPILAKHGDFLMGLRDAYDIALAPAAEAAAVLRRDIDTIVMQKISRRDRAALLIEANVIASCEKDILTSWPSGESYMRSQYKLSREGTHVAVRHARNPEWLRVSRVMIDNQNEMACDRLEDDAGSPSP